MKALHLFISQASFRFAKSVSFSCVLLPLVLAGCAPTSSAPRNYSEDLDINGLILDKSQKGALVYTRPGAAALSEYDEFIVDPVIVKYSDPAMKELPADQVTRIQSYFHAAVVEELTEGGYTIGSRSEPDRLRIALTIAGLKAPSAAGNVTNLLLPVSVSVGEVTVEARFSNSATNEVDGLVISRSKGSRVLNSTPWSNWADVEKSLNAWAADFRSAVDKAHG